MPKSWGNVKRGITVKENGVVPVPFVENDIQNVLKHLAGFFDGQIRIEMADKVRKSHHQVVKDVRTNVDAGNDFLSGNEINTNKVLVLYSLISRNKGRTDVLF